MSAIKLSFSLRTTSNVKQVHLVGSWDSYKGQFPLARDSSSSSSSKGSKWTGTFRFTGKSLKPGQRYWFYYMLDGYAVSHDPSREYTVEPTTGRKLNILDVPQQSGLSVNTSSSAYTTKSSARRSSREIPRGQPASEIRSPRPVRPGRLAKKLEQTVDDNADEIERQIAENERAMRVLAAKMQAANLTSCFEDETEDEEDYSEDEQDSSQCPSLASSSLCSPISPTSPTSSAFGSVCSCERYGITRRGDRVKLDCGGRRCGLEDCESEDEEVTSYRVRVRDHRHK